MLSVLLTALTVINKSPVDIMTGNNQFNYKVFSYKEVRFISTISSLLTDEEIVHFITSKKLDKIKAALPSPIRKVIGCPISYNNSQGAYADLVSIDIEKRTRIFEKVDAGENLRRVGRDEGITRERIRCLLELREVKIHENKIIDFIKNNPYEATINTGGIMDPAMYEDLGHLFNLYSYLFVHAVFNHQIIFPIFVFSMILFWVGGSLIFLKIAIMVIMNMGVKKDGRFKTGKKNNYTSEKALSDGAEMTKSFIPIMLFSVKWGYLIHLFYFISLWYFYDGLAIFVPSFILSSLVLPLIIIDQ